MLNWLLRIVVLSLLWLRYRITIRGLREITARGNTGILFLPTHPALIDPIMLTATLMRDFQARPFADQDAVNLPGVRWLASRVRALTIPTIANYGQAAMARIAATVQESITALNAGDSIILYPAGALLRSRYEAVGGNSAVETILRALPDVRVVLVRTRGLWGSSFGQVSGKEANAGAVLQRAIPQILSNLLFFTPRRNVDIYFEEPADFPREADRATINAYLERFYNVEAPPALYVPYTMWERGGRRELPDPEWGGLPGNVEDVPAGTRDIVLARLREMTGRVTIADTDRLETDLSMDSLARAELLAWLEAEFGFPQGNADSLQTVADVLLAALGEGVARANVTLKPVPEAWFAPDTDAVVTVAPGDTIAAAFLNMARREPNRVIAADQNSGARSYRELVMGVLALLPAVKALPGEHLGIMLPASMGAMLAYLTTVFAGRTPVMINWTVGRRNLLHALELTGTRRILTAKALVAKLEKAGLDLEGIKERFVYLEDLAAGLTKGQKLRALLGSYLNWGALTSARIAPTAAVLFTSGSESLPKAVPLSHANILANLRDTLPMIKLRRADRMLAMLPPFHSFGLSGNLAAPLVAGLRAVYHANPTEGGVLGKLTAAYRATLILGTPTFLNGVLRAAPAAHLATVRLAVTGAEECPRRVYELFGAHCPKATIIEGYGITECSPIVAVNDPDAPRPHAIGKLLPSLEFAVLDPATETPVSPGAAGMLLVRGPSIFGGYLGDAPSPFVDYDGKSWYRTGDLVRLGDDGVFTFAGRLKRFIKLGGEMISLPAIESALLERLGSAEDDGPILAVGATADERPELVLFTVKPVDREGANAILRDAGLSALHNLRRVEPVDAIPVLGTGKTDYRALQGLLMNEAKT
jgi:acyl-CoA synthetase (AMP-forming)/AMP-acid ligase II/1-acyl-sn-glycerol-3-phosphate acyltransferase